MKAYKFRSSAQIGFAFDIIINNRLYCSEWNNLNDPMEGAFINSHNLKETSIAAAKVTGIITAKRKYKICSLSGTYDCHLLWAHYAGGFDGVAIEVELPDNDKNIKKVDSRGVFAFVNIDQHTYEEDAAKSILFSKYKEWEYEKEIRILSEKPFYKLPKPVSRVIAGHRMDKALFDVLNIVCTNLGITLNRVGIGDTGIDADYVKPYESLSRTGDVTKFK